MRVTARLPGYQYLFATNDPQTVVLRLPTEGVSGLLGRKKEWTLSRSNPERNSKAISEAATHLPVWALEKGILDQAMEEIQRWQNPELYQLLDEWE